MKRILIIDDNKEIRESIAEILTLSGFDTLTAQNGKEGMELAIKENPALIICDIMMPVLDGYGVLHSLQKFPETKHIPFIFLTAKNESKDYRTAMEMGADDFITKPLDDIALLKAVETRLKKYDVLHSKYKATETGANELLKDLCDTGLLNLSSARYETEIFLKKNNLYIANKRPQYLYYLKSGKVKTYKQNDDGKIYIINLYTKGDFIGYMALLQNKNYDESAEVLEEAELILIPKNDFLTAISNDMAVAGKFINLITNNVKDQEQRLINMAYSSLRKRIASALVIIEGKLNKNGMKDQVINISRYDIARYVGTATESLIRTLSDLKHEKLIDIIDGKVKIVNLSGLNDMVY